MYHLLAQQNNPLEPDVVRAMEIIALCETTFGTRPQLNTVLTVLKENAERMQTMLDNPGGYWFGKAGMIAPGSIARRRLNLDAVTTPKLQAVVKHLFI